MSAHPKARPKMEREVFNATHKDFRGGTIRDKDRSVLIGTSRGTTTVYLASMSDDDLLTLHRERCGSKT